MIQKPYPSATSFISIESREHWLLYNLYLALWKLRDSPLEKKRDVAGGVWSALARLNAFYDGDTGAKPRFGVVLGKNRKGPGNGRGRKGTSPKGQTNDEAYP